MTDQLKTAMSDYPNELRVVMHAAGYAEDDDGDYVLPMSIHEACSRGPKSLGSCLIGGDVALCQCPTDNDAIVACIKWLMEEAEMNSGDWRDVRCFNSKHELLIALLITVRDAMA